MFEKLSTMTTSTETPLERAVRAAVSMVVRSESASHPVGSVTMPVVVTGEVANAGAPSAIRSEVSIAATLKRRIRDTGSSCIVVNRLTYTTARALVSDVTHYAKRGCC